MTSLSAPDARSRVRIMRMQRAAILTGSVEQRKPTEVLRALMHTQTTSSLGLCDKFTEVCIYAILCNMSTAQHFVENMADNHSM